MTANSETCTVATGLEKVSFHSNPKEGQCQRMVKLIVLISHASKVTLKTFQARLQLAWTENFQMYKLGLKKAEESEIKLPAFIWSWRKQENSRKTSTSASLTTLKPLTLKEMGIPDHLTCVLKNLYADQEATYNWTWNSSLVQNWERSMTKLYIVTLLI